ncbi:formylmethanofuran dehydrogenase subunit C [Xanthobacter sp. DSM 24535]|uniref:formylmethanofuran dehydrogenase subunit C n=1 Tax=Roseixanthobacter psychrophilus TaxID=3119917 RepID=UPI00372BFA31
MSGYELHLRGPLAARLSLAGLTPDALAGLTLAEVERQPLAYGTARVPLAEVFTVSPAPDGALSVSGDPRLDFVGADLSSGVLQVFGPVGAFAGARMTGGRLAISGDTGEGLASGMTGGRITVKGEVGARLGGPLPGERRGMTGGIVEIAGDVGPLAGTQMRGGLVLISGHAGDSVARGMIAGTIAVSGTLGAQAGADMKRGTLLLAQEPHLLAPGIGDAREHDLIALQLIARRVPEIAALFGGALSGRARRYVGDRLVGGQGEMLWLL